MKTETEINKKVDDIMNDINKDENLCIIRDTLERHFKSEVNKKEIIKEIKEMDYIDFHEIIDVVRERHNNHMMGCKK